jgi:hypothetical protein
MFLFYSRKTIRPGMKPNNFNKLKRDFARKAKNKNNFSSLF